MKESEVKKYCTQIDKVLSEIAKSSKQASIDDFSKLVADYNRELNSLLSIYHDNKDFQQTLKPYVMYYRQLFAEFLKPATFPCRVYMSLLENKAGRMPRVC